MIKGDRKGLSSVVSVTLLILGTVIGVALLWAFVVKNVDKTSEIDEAGCLTVNLDLVSCNAYGACDYNQGGPYYEADIAIKRNVGAGNVTGLRFIFEDATGRKKAYDKDLSGLRLNELDTLRIIEPGIPVPSNSVNFLRVAALVGKDKDACSITSNRVRCIGQTPLLLAGMYANNTLGYSEQPPSSHRAGRCCMWPVNVSECYNGADPDYPFDSDTGELSNGLPPGNVSACCLYKPY